MRSNTIDKNELIWDHYDTLKRPGPPNISRHCDVEIKINNSGTFKNGEHRLALVYRFSKNAAKKIAPNTGYASTAVAEAFHRVYFKETPEGCGYKLSGAPKTERREMRYTIYDRKHWSMLEGRYYLLYDKENELYFIDWKKKLVNDF